ncbi:hypothetical protein K435DRAFT_877042 [Dendrothele bispora CBS 962.96]|uniref:Mid2 domain-containing protein n=1 Tax=Dendrothele bispora (strain CBS 962.96) TaxID=1314807 RepID=A0A4S8KQU9_DENBC|nr:hypothetical protein K435DRAFT_877042 [Dendrothele bispora CBS 962.96]
MKRFRASFFHLSTVLVLLAIQALAAQELTILNNQNAICGSSFTLQWRGGVCQYIHLPTSFHRVTYALLYSILEKRHMICKSGSVMLQVYIPVPGNLIGRTLDYQWFLAVIMLKDKGLQPLHFLLHHHLVRIYYPQLNEFSGNLWSLDSNSRISANLLVQDSVGNSDSRAIDLEPESSTLCSDHTSETLSQDSTPTTPSATEPENPSQDSTPTTTPSATEPENPSQDSTSVVVPNTTPMNASSTNIVAPKTTSMNADSTNIVAPKTTSMNANSTSVVTPNTTSMNVNSDVSRGHTQNIAGVVAGTVIGGAALILTLCGFSLVFYIRRRRQRQMRAFVIGDESHRQSGSPSSSSSEPESNGGKRNDTHASWMSQLPVESDEFPERTERHLSEVTDRSPTTQDLQVQVRQLMAENARLATLTIPPPAYQNEEGSFAL